MAANENGRPEELYTYDSFGGKKKTADKHFLWWCAGAYQKLLKDCPTEHSKYTGLGGVVLATFVLAALSSGYAIYSVFNNPAWSVVFALVWGLIIFNFDRFLVSTMRKYGITLRRQLAMTIPRLLLALLIGATIARPLELKIFEKEIDVKVAENRHHMVLLNDSLLRLENNAIVQAAGMEKNRLLTRKSALADTLHALQDAYIREADGTGGSFHRGIDKLTRMKKDAYDAALLSSGPENQQLDRQIAYQDSVLKDAAASGEAKKKAFEGQLQAATGFLERNKALADLSGQESSVFFANLLISLLIILIETGPILSKLIMNTGPYDIALAKMELISMAGHENELKKDRDLRSGKLDAAYQQKKQASEEFLETWSALQKKHVKEELDQWERGDKKIPARPPMQELAGMIKRQYDYEPDDLL